MTIVNITLCYKRFFKYQEYKGNVTLFYLVMGYFLVIITSNYSRLKIYLSNNKIR